MAASKATKKEDNATEDVCQSRETRQRCTRITAIASKSGRESCRDSTTQCGMRFAKALHGAQGKRGQERMNDRMCTDTRNTDTLLRREDAGGALTLWTRERSALVRQPSVLHFTLVDGVAID